MEVNVIGAGLAGCEAAWYLANKGVKVRLYEMRGVKSTEAHHTNEFAELVCSNSLRGSGLKVASGVLKEELIMFNSIIMKSAEMNRVPAGGAIAVDRENFAKNITEMIKTHKNIEVINEEVVDLPGGKTIIATGPLTSDNLAGTIGNMLGEDYLYFFDAAAPIIDKDSINMDVVYLKSRYDKGEAAYLNCPMNKEEFETFYKELINAECVEPKDFELKVFEGCMPFEEMARRGEKTLLFGPMKPVGLEKDKDTRRPYAVVQLRQDNASATMYNIVGFQTHLKFPEQKRIIRLIPGLEEAEILRYGVMHKNIYIKSPNVLNKHYQLKSNSDIFFAGQVTGVEGYVESAASGIVAAVNMYRYLNGKEMYEFPIETIMGSMINYITTTDANTFQPMNANYGLLPELGYKHGKRDRKELYGKRALEVMEKFMNDNNLGDFYE